ncbi:MAG: metalloregulator ArsR/SmtB family transcription factor [Peptostreptococcus sp.]|uniref:ArsR/SmtB family transcription factor n=1 Tax=Peptostreptococcus sp. TaxID=1262 RepID=UPI002FE6CE28
MEETKRKDVKTGDIEVCQTYCVHADAVDSVRKETPSDEMLDDLSELFKVFGDSTRIKIIYSLFEKELCVCDIAELLGMTQSAISHQLRVLKNNRLVKFRKSGKTVYYSLDDEHIRRIFDCGLCHVKEMYY